MRVVAGDIAGLLDILGVHKCLAVVGLSLVGISCVNFGLRYAWGMDKNIACDCNVALSVNNTRDWKARMTIALRGGLGAATGQLGCPGDSSSA